MQHPSSDARYCVYIVVYIIKFLHQQLMDLGSKLKKKRTPNSSIRAPRGPWNPWNLEPWGSQGRTVLYVIKTAGEVFHRSSNPPRMMKTWWISCWICHIHLDYPMTIHLSILGLVSLVRWVYKKSLLGANHGCECVESTCKGTRNHRNHSDTQVGWSFQ